MHFTRSHIEELGLRQLRFQQLEEAFDALNGFAEEFGKAWIEHIFGSSRFASVPSVFAEQG